VVPAHGETGLLESRTDNELYALYLGGDNEAMRAIVSRNSPRLFGFLLRMVPDPATCQELVQEAFLRLVRARPDFSGGVKVSTYLFTVARNLATDELRKRAHRRHLSLEQDGGDPERGGGGLHERIADKGSGTDDGAIRAELREKIGRSIEQLPAEQREVFCLRELEGMGFAEIAAVVGCNENTVKSRMRYALEKLRAILRETL